MQNSLCIPETLSCDPSSPAGVNRVVINPVLIKKPFSSVLSLLRDAERTAKDRKMRYRFFSPVKQHQGQSAGE